MRLPAYLDPLRKAPVAEVLQADQEAHSWHAKSLKSRTGFAPVGKGRH